MENSKMINYSDIKKGVNIVLDDIPHQVLDYSLEVRGRGSSIMQVKLKNLKNNQTISKTFRPADNFKEPDLERISLTFIYSNNNKFVFSKDDNRRIELAGEIIGNNRNYLKSNDTIQGLVFNDNIISIILPIKIKLKVTEAPPSVRAGRADAGTKQVTLETGCLINTPVFIEEGDIIEINTTSNEYIRRVEKK